MESNITYKLMDVTILSEKFGDIIPGEMNRTERDEFSFKAHKISDGVFLFSVNQVHLLLQGDNSLIEFNAEYLFHFFETPIAANKRKHPVKHVLSIHCRSAKFA